MAATLGDLEVSDSAMSAWVDPAQTLVCMPEMSIVELALPEYQAAGLGHALCRVRGFRCRDTGLVGMFARSMCADTSRTLIVYQEMDPVILGCAHDEIQKQAAPQVLRVMYERGMPVELVTLGALRASQFDDVEDLIGFVETYHERATWLEAHPLDAVIANIEAQKDANYRIR